MWMPDSYVVATAGHVDHGKSTLVRALTGIEPDRWATGMEVDEDLSGDLRPEARALIEHWLGLLAERAPLSTPDPRWDRLLYGIHAVERHLRALA